MQLSLTIPFFNESANVATVVHYLATTLVENGVPHELILVDNGSSDDTRGQIGALVRTYPQARLVVVERNLGYGWGILQGLREARGDVLGFMVGDGQVNPYAVVQVYRKLLEERLELCKTTRVVRHDGWQRVWLTRWGNRLFRWAFPSLHTWDINGGPKLFTRQLFERLQLTSKDWFLDAELLIKASARGARIGEVPIESPPRRSGRSHVNWATVAEFVWNLLRYRWGSAMNEGSQG